METIIARLRIRFPTLPQDILRKIDRCRLARVGILIRHIGLPGHVCWIIEAKVRLAGELPDSYVPRMLEMGKSSYSRKRRAKRMNVCYKCARWNCNTKCISHGMASFNREDKIKFLKNGPRNEPLDNIVQALERHPSGDVHRVLLKLVELFEQEKEHYSLQNLTLRDPLCQSVRALDRN